MNLNDWIKKYNEKLDWLPSDIGLSELEMTLVGAMRREYTLKNAIKDIKHNYDYILISLKFR